MKNKKTTYLLVILTVVVWGAIIYRIIDHIHGSNDVPRSSLLIPDTEPLFSEIDTAYTLKLNYKDPFLKGGNSYTRTATGTKKEPVRQSNNIRRRIYQSNQPKVETKKTDWPDIQFSGIILNEKTNEKLGLVQVKTESFLFRVNETRNEIQLLELYPDSVIVKFQNEVKTIKKSE